MKFKIGSTYTLGYGIGKVKIEKPTAKGKTFKAVRLSDGKSLHFGDSSMPTRQDNPKAKKAYCDRASGLAPRGFNPNTFALIDWGCIPARGESNSMSEVRINMVSTINSKKAKVDFVTEDGAGVYYIRNHKWLINEIVLNGGIYTKEENEKGFQSMEGRLFTNGHPKVDGKFVGISNQDNSLANKALEAHYIGASVLNVRKEGDVYYHDIRVPVNIANALEGGKQLVEWCKSVRDFHANKGEAPSSIHTSTGLLCNRVEMTGNSRGKNYTWSAVNQQYDHQAILFNEVGAGGDEISLAVNSIGADVDMMTVNLENAEQPESDILFLPTEDKPEERQTFLDKVANALSINVKSLMTLMTTNGDKPMALSETTKEIMLNALTKAGEKTEALTDEQICDRYAALNEDDDEDDDDEEEENGKKYNKGKKKGDKEMKGNSLSTEQIQQLIADGIAQGLALNAANAEKAEKETLVNSLIANAAYSEDDKEGLMATPLSVLKKMSAPSGSAPISRGFSANANDDVTGLMNMEMEG
ncbi:MAG: hypothetical protein GY928_36525 [Colwellia sp.]|nr:hypothetical protein [Colwellia sp.]